ncbi:MAG: hypothetical protein JWP97_118 [Labilithrix sp.]|nr:hypothetical protein [Labilithrix sp.]
MNQPRKPGRVEGKKLLLVLLGGIILVVGILFAIGLTSSSTHVPLSKPGIGFTTDPPPSSAGAVTDNGAVVDAGITRTIADRSVRDALRKRILEGWAHSEDPAIAAAAKGGRFLPAPPGDGGTGMDPAYIQEVVRTEFFPMAKACYEELLSRKDAGGRVAMKFTIVADEKLGGIVEDASADPDGGVADERMSTCMRESLSTLAFRPPAHGGTVTVEYPIEFSNDPDPD